MKTELSYRTFEDLIAAVRSDLPTYDLEGFIRDGELIKIALKINYELGLRAHPTREKILDVRNGRVKLPGDFNVLNFALVCTSGVAEYGADLMSEACSTLDELRRLARLMNARPYEGTQTFSNGENALNHNLGVTDLVIRLYDLDGNLVPFTYRPVNENSIVINVTLTEDTPLKIQIIGAANATRCTLQIPECPEETACVVESCGQRLRRWKTMEPLEMAPGSVRPMAHLHTYHTPTGQLKSGYLETSFEEGTVYINYQSRMEGEDGELLVYDNPVINEYYEYALKQRLLENMILNGESADKALQLVELRFPKARRAALSLAHTPDFAELKKITQLNRQAMYQRFFNAYQF